MNAQVTPMRKLATVGIALLLAVAANTLAPASTQEITINDRAADVISEIATVVGEFRLGDLPAQLNIKANAMKFDYDRGVLAYTGDVSVRHGGVRISADRLTFGFVPGGEQTLKSVKAKGNVTVVHGDETAYGDTGSYDPATAIITLTGKARLGSGSNSLSGESVVVYLDKRRATVEGGGGPVRAVINPGELKEIEKKGVFD